MKSGDIAALLVQGFQQQATGNTDVGYHLGVVKSWDDATGINTVTVSGNDFSNLRVITAGPAVNIGAGDTVVILRYQTSYFIMGKVAAPGAGAAIRAVSGFISAAGTTSSVPYADLPTFGPSVQAYVGSSGAVLVSLSAHFQLDASTYGYMSVAMTGANTAVAQDFRAAVRNLAGAPADDFGNSHSFMVQITGLTPGLTTFTAKYRSSGANATFINRSLIVIPM